MRRDGARFLAAVSLLLTAIWMAPAPVARGTDAAVASPKPHTVAPAKPDQRVAFARRVFVITDVVLQNHIDPPTRQEMIRGGFKALLDEAKQACPADLSARVSEVRTREDLTALLTQIWPKSTKARGYLAGAMLRLVGLGLGMTPEMVNDLVQLFGAGDASEAQLERVFVGGLLGAVPGHVGLLPRKEARVQSQLQANRYVGIGIALSMEDKTKLPRIKKVFPNGPADGAGIRGGDLITEIEHEPVASGTRLVKVVERLRGAEGTELALRIRRGDSKVPLAFTLLRIPVMIAPVHEVSDDPALDKDPSLRVGHLKIDSITASTAQELRSSERKLRAAGMGAVILDLRGTGDRGEGVHHSAILLADSLLDGKPIGTLRTRNGIRQFMADRDCLFRGWPLVILVDENTSGAAEWVAAALQDADPPTQPRNRRAIVVGSRSGGDNFVRSEVPLPDSDEVLVLATGLWERPDAARSRPVATPDDALNAQFGPDAPDAEDDTAFRPWRVVPDVVVANAARSPGKAQRKIVAVKKSSRGAAALPPSREPPDIVKIAVEQLRRQWHFDGKTTK